MKLLLLKILLKSRDQDDGYVLPMVIALGLVMVLLGAVNLTSANEENINAVTENSRSDALGIAEVGVARYREFLNNNRILTVYNHDQWTSVPVPGAPTPAPNVAGQTCDVVSNTAGGWAYTEGANVAFNANNWRPVTLNETILNRDLDGDNLVNNNAVIVGRYQLVSYEYDNDRVLGDNDDNGLFNQLNDANTDDDPSPPAPQPPVVPVRSITEENDFNDDGISDARGILTIRARTAEANPSETQVRVEIPLRINEEDMNNLAPALWVDDWSLTTLGGLVVGDADGDNITDDVINNLDGSPGADGIPDANIVASRPNNGTTNGCADIASINNNTIVTDPRNLPPIDSIIGDVANANAAATANSVANINFPTAPAAGTFLGAIGDFAYNPNNTNPADFDPDEDDPLVPLENRCNTIADCRFYYDNVGVVSLSNDLLTDGVSQVTLYDNAAISITANADLTIGSTVSSPYLEIYSNTGITINTGGNDVIINGFIHTPGALTISGGGTLTINGSVWAGSLNNTIGTLGAVRINPDTTGISSTASDRSYEFYTTTADKTPRPLTSSPTNWRTEEIN